MPRTTEQLLKAAEEVAKMAALTEVTITGLPVISHAIHSPIKIKQIDEVAFTRKELNRCASLIAELAAKLREREWQDMSTAPKDGNDILVANEDEFQAVAQWWVEGWHTLTHQEVYATHPLPLCFEPTKWQPLPTPPKKED